MKIVGNEYLHLQVKIWLLPSPTGGWCSLACLEMAIYHPAGLSADYLHEYIRELQIQFGASN